MKGNVGDTHGYLTIDEVATFKNLSGRTRAVYFCICKCGNTVRVVDSHWGRNESCGCKRKDSAKSMWAARKAAKAAQKESAKRLDGFLTGYRPNAQTR